MMRIFGVDQLKIMIILFEIDQKESLPSLADCFTQLSHIVYRPRRRIVTAWRNFSLVLVHLWWLCLKVCCRHCRHFQTQICFCFPQKLPYPFRIRPILKSPRSVTYFWVCINTKDPVALIFSQGVDVFDLFTPWRYLSNLCDAFWRRGRRRVRGGEGRIIRYILS